ncbi:type II toxin-antitoxin system VapC family toxin [Roseateles koreensis]|uniref:Type II toxin-antitoxin system VapC family toxin n=1 Tax=Roseateles koreensis TaxID=2987526 RepID=A0ABT5KYL1_9BURK|nr:type II toxin-antitoxin system VapC family toxin [Roseateles koreensis]MDC8786891.1 type II toxin-antitoxin system VapC family toxin [Roseateles koreensis]
MIAIDSAVLIDLLSGSERADMAEAALREALNHGPVVVCAVVVAEVCASLQGGDQALQALEDMGLSYSTVEPKAAIRAGEMQRRYRARGGSRQRTVPDFIVGAHALLQCSGLITNDDGFFRDYFKGLKLIKPQAAP